MKIFFINLELLSLHRLLLLFLPFKVDLKFGKILNKDFVFVHVQVSTFQKMQSKTVITLAF